MNPDIRQLVASYEEAGMSPEEIAQVDGLQLGAVKAILAAHSPKFRADTKQCSANLATQATEKDFTSTDNDEALAVIKRIATMSDDDSVALKAAMFIRNDKKKRLDPQKAAGQFVQNNILVLNEHFAAVGKQLASKILPASKQSTELTSV